MSYSRTLARHLDHDLIARIEASGRPEQPKRAARKKTPRLGWTYRGARRNEARKTGAVMRRAGPEPIETMLPMPLLNRSDKWPRAKTYAYAREISPSS